MFSYKRWHYDKSKQMCVSHIYIIPLKMSNNIAHTGCYAISSRIFLKCTKCCCIQRLKRLVDLLYFQFKEKQTQLYTTPNAFQLLTLLHQKNLLPPQHSISFPFCIFSWIPFSQHIWVALSNWTSVSLSSSILNTHILSTTVFDTRYKRRIFKCVFTNMLIVVLTDL